MRGIRKADLARGSTTVTEKEENAMERVSRGRVGNIFVSKTETLYKRFMMMLGSIFLVFVITYAPAVLIKPADRCFSMPAIHVIGKFLQTLSSDPGREKLS